MIIRGSMQVLFSAIRGLVSLPEQVTGAVSCLQESVNTLFSSSSIDLEEGCKDAQARINSLERQFCLANAFIEARPDLAALFQRTLAQDGRFIVQGKPPAENQADDAISAWNALLSKEIYLKFRWNELLHFVNSHSELKASVMAHVLAAQKSDDISLSDRDFLSLFATQDSE